MNYLNTVPLAWGMLYGPQRDHVRLQFEIPSLCAQAVEQGTSRIGLVPVAEVARQGLEITPGPGIACRGAVRSILLVSRKPIRQIRTLAADRSSRTSVELARLVLRELYGTQPEIHEAQPDLEPMLAGADAALLIGDSALRIDPYSLPYEVLDLGAEWFALTALPMVFALWAGKPGSSGVQAARLLDASYRFGCDHIEDIVKLEHERRGIAPELAHEYLTRYIHYEVGDEEWKGLEAFLQLARLPDVNPALAQAG